MPDLDVTEIFRSICREFNKQIRGMDSRADLESQSIKNQYRRYSKSKEIFEFLLHSYLLHGFIDCVQGRVFLYRKLDPQIALLDYLASNYDKYKDGPNCMKSNVVGLDTILKGGLFIPDSSGIHILIKGEPGAGKTTLALQLAHNLASLGQKIFYVAAEQSFEELELVMKRFEPLPRIEKPSIRSIKEVKALLRHGRFNVRDNAVIIGSWQPTKYFSKYEPKNLGDYGKLKAETIMMASAFINETKKMGFFPNWLIIDSANAIPGILHRDLIKEIREILGLKSKRLSFIFISEEMNPDERVHTDEEFVADMIFELGHRHFEIAEAPNPSNDYDQRYIDITKSRYQSVHRGQHPLSIKDNGIVIHNSSAIAFKITSKTAHPLLTSKLDFGIASLNHLANSSILKGSTTLLTGNDIQMKLALSLQFLAKGLEDKENCAIYYFSDNRRELETFLESHAFGTGDESIGEAFKEELKNGKLDIRCITPGYLFPEDFLGNFEREIKDDNLYALLEQRRVSILINQLLHGKPSSPIEIEKRLAILRAGDKRYADVVDHPIEDGKTPSVTRSRIVIADVDKVAAQFPIIYKNEFFFQTLFQILRKYGISCMIIDSRLEIGERRRYVDLRPLVDNIISVNEDSSGKNIRTKVVIESSLRMTHRREPICLIESIKQKKHRDLVYLEPEHDEDCQEKARVNGMERTLVLLKPDAHEMGVVDTVIEVIRKNNISVQRRRRFDRGAISRHVLEQHYANLKKDDLENAISYMQSGAVTALICSGDNAIARLRELVGRSFDPSECEEGSIRRTFARDSMVAARAEHRSVRNVIHASDSSESAKHEIELWFGNALDIHCVDETTS